MGKKIRLVLIAVLLGIFLFSAWHIWGVLHEYQVSEEIYQDAAARYTAVKNDGQSGSYGGEAGSVEGGSTDAGNGEVPDDGAPVTVDFEGLWEVTEDVAGWIYCEGTTINYPVLKGKDNDTYLRHAYDGSYSEAGCIFIEEKNREGFADSNTIIYGHNMNDGSMFADLKKWAEEDFYKEHPYLWLVTPEQDYRIDIFSCYVTSGYSDTYTIYTGPCEEFGEYLAKCREQSVYETETEPDSRARCVVLSTCSYVFEDARTVLHGVLTPVGRKNR